VIVIVSITAKSISLRIGLNKFAAIGISYIQEREGERDIH
jgi:hypothetical protein